MDVFTLLSLPKTSAGLSALKTSISEAHIDAPASRKTPRLEADSDSASASRAQAGRREDVGGETRTAGPIQITLVGDFTAQPIDTPTTSGLMRRCIRLILTRTPNGVDEVLPATHEGIYASCRWLVCVANQSEGLHEIFKLEMEQCARRLKEELCKPVEDPIAWLGLFVDVCKWFEARVGLLRSLLTFLDQLYVLKQNGVLSTNDLSFKLFSDRIFEDRIISERIRAGVKEWANWERSMRSIQHEKRQHVLDLIPHLTKHRKYDVFEEHYLKFTREYYAAESNTQAEEMRHDAKAFLKHCNQRVEEEQKRSMEVLSAGSWGVVREATERALLEDRLQWVSEGALGILINEKDLVTLTSMYRLFSRVDGLNVLCSALGNHITDTVRRIVQDAAEDDRMVQRLLDFKAAADTAVKNAFLDVPTADMASTAASTSAAAEDAHKPNQDFVYALERGFRTGFKARRIRPAELIAKYLDKAMRRGQGASTDDTFQALLDSVLALYRFTDDKDVFRTFYHRSLAKRLLLEKSASDDFEKAMLAKLKEQYDAEFGMGEEMFKDLALSRDSMRQYHETLDDHDPGKKLSVMVLQRSAWPFTVPKSSIDLPPNMQADLTRYADYYKERHQGHALDWDHGLGTVTLKGRFKAGLKELSVSLYQAVVLFLFNTSDELSFKEIAAQTNLGLSRSLLKIYSQRMVFSWQRIVNYDACSRVWHVARHASFANHLTAEMLPMTTFSDSIMISRTLALKSMLTRSRPR
ncbi:hypothetical protein HGRIS_007358 [Hohenbuehelia grisea]|uniref:Cullin family profile domain-containing protein n=1 Tax=Hohenbuehelia grisea TaxID=104357 RepID=A0ABR3J4X9_9AGAR